MRIVLIAIIASLLLGGCGTISEFDTNRTVDANPACLIGEGALGESSECRRATGVEIGGKSQPIDFGGTDKDGKKPQ